MPLSGGHKDTFVGWAATLVNTLDTLYIIGLKDEFEEALKALEQVDFSKPNSDHVPIFETTIRYLGGLLGAWDISGHKYTILLEKAKELGDFLYRAFDTKSGAPVPYYKWKQYSSTGGKLAGENGVIVAQIGSLSLEFIRLSQVTGDPKYTDAIQKITNQLENTQNYTTLPGMWPSQVDCAGSQLLFSSQAYTLGVFAGKFVFCFKLSITNNVNVLDSLFEYLPKTHLLLSRSSQQYLNMYRTALPSFGKSLFFRPSLTDNPDILFTSSLSTVSEDLDTQVQHLSCFVGGIVGLGSRINYSPDELDTARRLTDGCVWAYENTPSGIMPEIFHVNKCPSLASCTWNGEGTGFTRVDDSSY
jgi:mannosyl-oligosaccharide alpha-1,2-mannosidase